jgi:hypothetical protein
MGELAERLADQFEVAISVVIAATESGRFADNEARIVAHHMATSNALVLSLAQAIVNREPLPSISWQMIHEINVQHVRANTTVGRGEAVELLRTTTASAAAAIRKLSDAQLEATASWGPGAEDVAVSARSMIEAHMIRHAEEHVAAISSAA